MYIYTFIYRYKSHKFEMPQQESLHPCASTGSQDQLDWPGASQRSCCSLLRLKCCVQTLARKEEVERPKEKDQPRRINKGTKSGTFLDYHIPKKSTPFFVKPLLPSPGKACNGGALPICFMVSKYWEITRRCDSSWSSRKLVQPTNFPQRDGNDIKINIA